MPTLPLWGQLEKAQDDPTTIDEAIAAAIAEHNDDPTAHLGEGQSLQQHRSDEVIDARAGSIPPDKLKKNFYQNLGIVGGWQSLDAFFTEGSPINLRFDWVYFLSGSSVGNYKSISAKAGVNYDDNPFLDVGLKVTNFGSQVKGIAYFGMGEGYVSEDEPFVGFKIIDGALYGNINVNLGTTDETVLISGVTLTVWHAYRVEYERGYGARFYVDGELVGTIENTDCDGQSGSAFAARAENNGAGNQIQLEIRPFVYGQGDLT